MRSQPVLKKDSPKKVESKKMEDEMFRSASKAQKNELNQVEGNLESLEQHLDAPLKE